MNIIELAKKACAPNQTFNSDPEWVERFAALVAAHEREACAKVCEKAMIQMNYSEAPYKQCAAAIRGMK